MRKTGMSAQLLSGSALAKFFVVFFRRFGDAAGIHQQCIAGAEPNLSHRALPVCLETKHRGGWFERANRTVWVHEKCQENSSEREAPN
jgi:hypothetical protein